MADYISIDTQTDVLNTDLNTISNELFGTGDIARDIPFNVVANVQDYEDDKAYSSDVKVPGIVTALSGTVAPSQKYQAYSDVVLLTIYAFTREVEDTLQVVNEYINQNTGKFSKTDDWTYQLSFERPTVINRGVDEGEERVSILLNITYNYVFKGYTSDDITLKIDGDIIPVTSYSHSMQKIGTDNANLVNVGILKSRPHSSKITKDISMVHVDITGANKIHEDIDAGNLYSRTYSVFYGLGCDENGENCTYNNTEVMVLTEGNIQVIEGGFQTLTTKFEIYNDLS